jgi:transposase
MAAKRFRLSSSEWEALDRMRFSTTSKVLFRNATIILMSDAAVGRTKASIAHDLGCSVATVDSIRARYRSAGVEGLKDKKRVGRPSRATPEYRATLRTTVATPPGLLGYGFSVWSVGRLNAHLKKSTGISFSEDQLTRLLHEEEFSFQRPKHTMKGKRDEAAYVQAAARLERLKKRPSVTMPALN